MRRYAPSQYQQVLLLAPTAALYCISNPTTASTFALACCDDFCQRRAKLYLTYCKRAFGKPQSGKSAQQAHANAYFSRRSVACMGNSSAGPHTLVNKLRRRNSFTNLLWRPFSSGCTPRAFGAHFTRYPSGRCFDFAQHDITKYRKPQLVSN